jgi:hypothetical protein
MRAKAEDDFPLPESPVKTSPTPSTFTQDAWIEWIPADKKREYKKRLPKR